MMETTYPEPSFADYVRPLISHIWVLVTAGAVGLSLSIALALLPGQVYESGSIIKVNETYAEPEAYAGLVEEYGVRAKVKPGTNLIWLHGTGPTGSAAKGKVTAAIEGATLNLQATLPDYASKRQETMARLQDTLALFNETEDVSARIVTGAEIYRLVGQVHTYAEMESNVDRLAVIVTEPSEPTQAQDPRLVSKGLVGIAAGLLAGALAVLGWSGWRNSPDTGND